MQMLPGLRSHDEYIKFTGKNLQDVHIPKAHDDVLPKLKLLDLTLVRLLSMPLYSKKQGRPSFAPEDMMRTYVAMVLCGITSPTDWVNDYLEDKSGFYAIISGFQPGDTPSVGSACMTSPVGFWTSPNTIKPITYAQRRRNSPEPKKKPERGQGKSHRKTYQDHSQTS